MARITVKTAAPESGEEPESFLLLGKRFTVREVIDRWFGEEYAYFKVRAEDGVIYILRYSLDEAEWELVVMDAADAVKVFREKPANPGEGGSWKGRSSGF